MQRMAAEISMAYLSKHCNAEEPRNKTIFIGKRSRHGMRLDFASFSHFKMRADANESDQNELSYFVDRDPDDKQETALMRREQARIDDEPEEGGVEQVLAHGVKELSFEFYEPKQERWQDEWDSTRMDQKHRLPTFVRIEMVALGPDGKTEEKFVTKARILMKKDAIQISTSGGPSCLDQ
jgi:general secretion pathway protein J